MKLLIVRLSALGDIVHALPLAQNARRAGAAVGWVCESRYREVLEGNPNLDRLFSADTRAWRKSPLSLVARRGLRALAGELAAFSPDATIDAQGLWKSALLARRAGAPVVGFDALERREGLSALLCERRVRPSRQARHVVDRSLALLSAAGISIETRAPDARYLLARESPEAAAFLASQPRPFVVFHSGASRPEKLFGEGRLAEVARILRGRRGVHTVISWGPGDERRAERMAASLPGAARIPALCPRGLAHALAAAALVVGGDTGPLHLADALGVGTLCLFGESNGRNTPERNGPYRGASMRYDGTTTAEEVAARALLLL